MMIRPKGAKLSKADQKTMRQAAALRARRERDEAAARARTEQEERHAAHRTRKAHAAQQALEAAEARHQHQQRLDHWRDEALERLLDEHDPTDVLLDLVGDQPAQGDLDDALCALTGAARLVGYLGASDPQTVRDAVQERVDALASIDPAQLNVLRHARRALREQADPGALARLICHIQQVGRLTGQPPVATPVATTTIAAHAAFLIARDDELAAR